MQRQVPATLPVIVEAVERLLATAGPASPERLLALLADEGVDLGVDAASTLDDVLWSDDLPGAFRLLDGRWASVEALLAGRIFTHRLTAAEAAFDLLDLDVDLEPLASLTERAVEPRRVDGSPVVEVVAGFDDELLAERGIPAGGLAREAALLLPAGTLGALGAGEGDVVGVRVAEGRLALEATPPATLGAPPVDVAELQGLFTDDDGEAVRPQVWEEVVLTLCATDSALFRKPAPPLSELLEDWKLVAEGDLVAPAGFDFAWWRAERRLADIQKVHRLGDDEALAVLAIRTLHRDTQALLDAAATAEADGPDAAAGVYRAMPTAPTGETDETEPLAEEFSRGDDVEPDDDAWDERTVVRATLEFLDDPAVAEAVLAETIGVDRKGAAALGLLAESVEPSAPPAARPALRWLRGKAHERLGFLAEAEAAYTDALALDPQWPPALYDLARYASDRGEAERGLALLRRANAHPDDTLRVLLEHFRAPARPGLGRNDRCWCGSGRKYKQCHLGREQLPLSERAAWLYQKAGTYLQDGPWRLDLLNVAKARAAHWPGLLAALDDPLVADVMLFEGGAFAEFLDVRGPLLPDDERLLGEQWLLVERSLFEIETVRPGHGIGVRDVRTGDRHDVRERTASRQVRPGDLFCGRVVPADDTIQLFGGIEPVALGQRDEVIALLDDEPDPLTLVGYLSQRFAPPRLANTEGDPLVLCQTRLAVADPDQVAAELDTAYGPAEVDGADRVWIEHVTTHGLERVRATVRLAGGVLTVETNSEARHQRVLDTVRRVAPDATVLDDERAPVDDLREAMRRAPVPPGGNQPADLLAGDDSEIAAILDTVIRAHEQAWVDEEIPALGGLTPRQAAADPTREKTSPASSTPSPPTISPAP